MPRYYRGMTLVPGSQVMTPDLLLLTKTFYAAFPAMHWAGGFGPIIHAEDARGNAFYCRWEQTPDGVRFGNMVPATDDAINARIREWRGW